MYVSAIGRKWLQRALVRSISRMQQCLGMRQLSRAPTKQSGSNLRTTRGCHESRLYTDFVKREIRTKSVPPRFLEQKRLGLSDKTIAATIQMLLE